LDKRNQLKFNLIDSKVTKLITSFQQLTDRKINFTRQILHFTIFSFLSPAWRDIFVSSINLKKLNTMKTAILTAALMILMTVASARTLTDTTSTPAPAEQIFKVWVIQQDANLVKFRVHNPSEEKVVLKIYNDKNVKVFHRTVKSEKDMSIIADMTNCGTGTYTCVVLRNGQEEVRKPITR
jgi:hypothetical protein